MYKFCIYISLLFFSVSSAFAEVKNVSVDDCIDIALQNHPDIKISSENQIQSVAAYRAVEANDKVQVAAGVNTAEYLKEGRSPGQISVPGKDTVFGLFAGLNATYRLVQPGQSDRLEVARKSIDISKLNDKSNRDRIIQNVRLNYYDYLNVMNVAQLKKQMKVNFESQLEFIRSRVERGEKPILDLSMAEVRYAQLSLESDKALNSEKAVKGELLSAMGLTEEEIDFTVKDILSVPKLKYELKDLYKLADSFSPQIKAAAIAKEISRINIDVAKSANLPSVNLTFGFGYLNKELLSDFDKAGENIKKDNWDPTVAAGLTASIPVYTGGAISAAVDSQVSAYNKSLYDERRALLQVRKSVKSFYQMMLSWQKQMDISKLTIQNAKTNLKLARLGYENGDNEQSVVSDAELSVLSAEMDFLSARYEYLKSLANLEYIIGVGEEFLCER